MKQLYRIGFITQHGTAGVAHVVADTNEAARVAVFDQWPGTISIEYAHEAGTVLVAL
jgi:hypothetical protein